jgi:hypothetical protein
MNADPASRPVELAQEPDFALASLVRPSSREVVRGADKEVLEPRVMQSQRRVFELLGTRPADKTQIAYDTGHFTLPPNRVAADVSDWFDHYLGRVRQ